jgi:SsrA-binding protein
MYVPKEAQPKKGGGADKAKDGEKGGKRKLVAQNKKARHDYAIIDVYEAGLVLTGTEVKSLRQGRASLTDGFVQIEGNEAWLHAAHIPEYSQGSWTNHSARRKRKLLLHREEIDKLIGAIERKGYTLIPMALYWKKNRVKVDLGVARGKQEHDKRDAEKERDWSREKQRTLRAKNPLG